MPLSPPSRRRFDDVGNPIVPLLQAVRHGVLVLQFAIPVTGFALASSDEKQRYCLDPPQQGS